jgi:hypothetical protein
MANNAPKSAETSALLGILQARQMSIDDLAAIVGVTVGTMHTQVSTNFRRLRLRLAVEAALGCPIWMGADDFGRRKLLTEHLGLDPYLIRVAQLRKLVAALKLPQRSTGRRRQDFIKGLENFLIQNPDIKKHE